MLRLHPISKLGFLDPWEVKHHFFYSLDEVRYNPDAMTDVEKAEMAALAGRSRQKGGLSYFSEVDQTVDVKTQGEKEKLLKDLEDFEKKTGISQAKARKKAADCKRPQDLDNLKLSLQRSGLEYLDSENNPNKPQGLLQKSMAFVPIHPAEKEILEAKEKTLRKFLRGLPATAPADPSNKINSIASAIINFDELVGPRLKFRNELKGQSKFVQEMFFLELGASTDPYVSEVDILNKVKQRVKGLEKAPQAKQKEYRKQLEGKKDPEKALEEVNKKFEALEKAYEDHLDPELFGGKMIQTPKGIMRAARWEYKEWFAKELKDFAHMERMLEVLKSREIPDRRAIYSKRNELLSHFPEEKAAKLREKTNEMRFHSLKAYIKDLEALSGKESSHALEYMAELEAAEEEGIALFTNEEKTHLKASILQDKPKLQEIQLTLLTEKEIPNRAAVIREFMQLPEYLRLGQQTRFTKMSMEQKRTFLRKISTTNKKTSANPFAKLADPEIEMDQTTEETRILHLLRSKEGRKQLRELSEKDQAARSAQVIAQVTKRTGSWIKQLEENDLTQMEGRMQEDAHYGLHGYNDAVWQVGFDNSLAKNEQDRYYGNTFKLDVKLRNAGFDRRSGGQIAENDLQVIDNESWMRGDDSMIDALDNAVYDRALFLGADGKDELNVRQVGKKAWLQNKEKMINALKIMLGLESASEAVIDELTYATMEINEAFGDTDDFYGIQTPANNSHHFEDEESLAA